MKISFSKQELTDKGFNIVKDGDEVYMEYVFEPNNYWHSKFLATPSTTKEEYLVGKLRVINPYNEEGDPFLSENRLNYIIKQGKF